MKRFFRKISAIVVATGIMVSSTMLSAFAEPPQIRASNLTYLVINSKTNYMAYYKNGEFVKEFRVATGKSSTPTPTGKFRIVNKIKNRPYFSGGIPGGSPNNPLGDRWIGLKVGATNGSTYAIHGNNNESSIGKHVSGGCIRMHNSEVRWLFDQIDTNGYAIIDYSDRTYSQIAAKYGISIDDPNSNTENIKNLEKQLIKLKTNNSIVNLSDKNSYIKNSSDATKIIELSKNYMSVYNKLNDKEKQNSNTKKIHSEYNNIMKVVEASQAVLKLYENISIGASDIYGDAQRANTINTNTTQELGTKGRATKELNEALSIEPISKSKRMTYINNIYNDVSRFLESSIALGNKNITLAKSKASQIKDANLKAVASKVLDKHSDIEGHWAQQNISDAMTSGWVGASNTFRPNDNITRAEFVTIVNKAFGFTKSGPLSFSDVSSGAWYAGEVAIAVNQGYINGYENNTFRPNDSITREEVASIITSIKVNKDENIDKIKNYSDYNQISNWAKSSVEGVVEAGYMGAGGVTFRPKDKITRAESIVTIQRSK